MILPIIDYADIFYHNKNIQLLQKFQVIQNRCIRNISKLPRMTNTDNEANRLSLLPLSERRALHVLQFALETANKQPSLLISNDQRLHSMCVQTCSHDHTRKQFKMFKPAKILVERSISFMLRKSWNSLPTSTHLLNDKYPLVSSC